MEHHIYNIYKKCIEKHGILPNSNDIIKSNDDLLILITKFNNWYNKADEFAWGDMRDQIGFSKTCNENINTIINDCSYNLISSNEFIQHMLFKLSNGNLGKCFELDNYNIFINTNTNNTNTINTNNTDFNPPNRSLVYDNTICELRP
jgi:hypothetical protein